MERSGNPSVELMEVANSLELADQLFATGQYRSSAAVYVTALGVLSRTFGEHDSDTIKCMQKAADSYFAAQNIKDALPLYGRLLTAGQEILGADHPDVAAMAAKIDDLKSTKPVVAVAKATPVIDDRASRLSYSSIAALRPEDISPTDWGQDWRLTTDRAPVVEPLQPSSPASSSPPGAPLPSLRSFGAKGAPPMKARGSAPSAKASEAESFLANAAEAVGGASPPPPAGNEPPQFQSPGVSRSQVPAAPQYQQPSQYQEIPQFDQPQEHEQPLPPEEGLDAYSEAGPPESEVFESQKPKRGRGSMRSTGEFVEGGKKQPRKEMSPARKDQMMRAVKIALLGAVPIVVVVVLAGWMAMTFGKLAPASDTIGSEATSAPVKPRRFSTADGGKVIQAGSAQDRAASAMNFAGTSDALVMPLLYVGPDLKDFVSACASCAQYKDLWLEKVPEGLRDEDGTLYYSGDAPELAVVRQMRKVADTGIRYYQGGTGYPKDKGVMGNLPYTVPGRGANILPVLTVNHLTSSDGRLALAYPDKGDASLYNSLQNPESATWLTETPGEDGDVHAMSAFYNAAEPPRSEFYVHGFDRQGQLIRGSDPARILLLASRNGDDLNAPPHYQLPQSKTRLIRLCIITLPNGISLHMMHGLLPCLMLALAFVMFMSARLGKGGAFRLGSFDILSIILLIVGLGWGYFLLFMP